jgi:hypothetical protein
MWLDPSNADVAARLLAKLNRSESDGLFMEWIRRLFGWRLAPVVNPHRIDYGALCARYGWTRPRMSGGLNLTTSRGGRGVAFLSDRPVARELKLARYLKRAGVEVQLLHPKTVSPAFDPSHCFAGTHAYDSPEALDRLLSGINPALIHAFLYKSYDTVADRLIEGTYPIVLDIYDPLNEMFSLDRLIALGWLADAQLEKFCIEMCHGLVARDTRFQIIKRECPVRFPDQVIFFPDYSDSEIDPSFPPKQRLKDGRVHFVYSGPFGPLRGPDNRDDRNFRDLVAICEKFGGTLHLFRAKQPSSLSDIEIGAPPTIEFHHAVPADHWIETIAPYDAMVIYTKGWSEGWPSPVWSSRNLRHALSNRLFDCIDAGLYMFASRHHGAARMARRWDIAVPSSMDALGTEEGWGAFRNLLDATDQPHPALRQRLSGYSQAERLIRFYERVCRSALAPNTEFTVADLPA